MKNQFFSVAILATIALSMLTSCEEITSLIVDEDLHAGCNNPFSFNYNPSATTDNGHCSSMKGCLGYQSGFVNSGERGLSLGDIQADNWMNKEVAEQRSFFNGIPANVFILYENRLKVYSIFIS